MYECIPGSYVIFKLVKKKHIFMITSLIVLKLGYKTRWLTLEAGEVK